MFYAVHGQRDLPHSMERRSAHAQPDLAHSWRAGLSMPRLNCRSVGAQTDLARSLSLSLSLWRVSMTGGQRTARTLLLKSKDPHVAGGRKMNEDAALPSVGGAIFGSPGKSFKTKKKPCKTLYKVLY